MDRRPSQWAAAIALAGAAFVAFGVIVVRADARVTPLASSPEAIRAGGKTAQPLSRTSLGSRCRQRKPADRRKCAQAAAGTRRGTGLIAFGSTLGSYSHLSEYSLVVFGGDFGIARRVKGKALHYEEVSVCADWNCSVPYGQAAAKGWLLRDKNGSLLHTYDDSRRYLPDLGLPAYQQAFIRTTLSILRAHPRVDGIEIDNVQTDIGSITHWTYPAKYPTGQAFQNAEVAFLSVVGPALRKAGYYVAANAGGYTNSSSFDSGRATNALWRRIAPYLGGLMNEFWMQDPNNLTRLMDDSGRWYMHCWSGWQKLVRTAQSRGADFIGVSIGGVSDVRTMRFGKASFLLDWNGHGGAFVYAIPPAYTSAVSPWNAAWTANIGTPTGRKRRVGSKIWRRNFTKGTVVVNPTSSSVTTSVNGTSYTIAPTDALILAR
jgi:putative glycosyl hydrolase-like family 15 (GHL15) protein